MDIHKDREGVDYVIIITPVVKLNDAWSERHFGAPVGSSFRLLALPTSSADSIYDTIYDHEVQAIDFALQLAETKKVKAIPPTWMRHLGTITEFKFQRRSAAEEMREIVVSRREGDFPDPDDAYYNVSGLATNGNITVLKENVQHRDAVKVMAEYQLLDRNLKFRQPFSKGFRLTTDTLPDVTDGFPYVIQLGYRMCQVGQLQKFRTIEERDAQAKALTDAFGITNHDTGVAHVAHTSNKVELPD